MLKFLSFMLCTSKNTSFSLGNYLGTSLIIGNLMMIRVTNVEWTWLGLEWPSCLGICLLLMMLLHLHLSSVIAKCHASLLSSFLLENSLYISVDELISFLKLVGNLDNMTVDKVGRQH